MDKDYVSPLPMSVVSLSLFCNGMLQEQGAQIPFAYPEKWQSGRCGESTARKASRFTPHRYAVLSVFVQHF